MEALYAQIDKLLPDGWVHAAVWGVILFAITAATARVATKLMRHVLRSDDNPLPSSSIIVNIVRATVWIIGGSTILGSCFNINVSSIIAGLGVVGIAVSLGFQDTLSNLIGGLQVTSVRIVQPGDNIQVGGQTGVVRDVSWRHTTITNTSGQTIIIPNSVISTTALVQLPPATLTVVPFAVATDDRPMDEVAEQVRALAAEAAAKVGTVTQEPKVLFAEITEYGFKGKVILQMEDPAEVSAAVDAIIRAIAPVTR